MELYQAVLCQILKEQPMEITFPNLQLDLNKVIEGRCYQALCQIKSVLANGASDDAECFAKIEEIVCLLEDLGIDVGNRHDF